MHSQAAPRAAAARWALRWIGGARRASRPETCSAPTGEGAHGRAPGRAKSARYGRLAPCVAFISSDNAAAVLAPAPWPTCAPPPSHACPLAGQALPRCRHPNPHNPRHGRARRTPAPRNIIYKHTVYRKHTTDGTTHSAKKQSKGSISRRISSGEQPRGGHPRRYGQLVWFFHLVGSRGPGSRCCAPVRRAWRAWAGAASLPRYPGICGTAFGCIRLPSAGQARLAEAPVSHAGRRAAIFQLGTDPPLASPFRMS